MKSRMITTKVANERLEVGLGCKTTRIILVRDETLAEKSHFVATLFRDMTSDQRGADAGSGGLDGRVCKPKKKHQLMFSRHGY